MDIKNLQRNWDEFGKSDPLWAIATHPDKKGGKWDIEEFFQLGRTEIDGIMAFIESRRIVIPKKKALDFGCGVGRLTQALALHFEKVIGVDIAPSMVELARKFNKHGDKCAYILNETDNLGVFPDNEFDFIYTNITLQHMEPRYAKNYLKEFIRILDPKGMLIFQVVTERNHRELPETRKVIIKKKVKSITPDIILSFYRALRNLRSRPQKDNDQPVMEMYGMEKADVMDFLAKNKGEILDVYCHGHDPHWQFMQFSVSKK